MNDLTTVWKSLDFRRRLIVIAATFAIFAAVLSLTRVATNPEMALLYSGLGPQQAGSIIDALEAEDIGYEIRGNAIFIGGNLRDITRMKLASQGLPSSVGAGYEILDELSGFGTTSQMFDAAYWRAKEGELARTISTSPEVKEVRVHIATQSSTVFKRTGDSSASIMVMPRGESLGSTSAEAFRFLVAAAVPNLLPENVTVIDSLSGRVIRNEDEQSWLTPGQGSHTEKLRSNVERLLHARLGIGNSVVEVALESITENETIVERELNPDSRVAISTDVEEIFTTSNDSNANAVTVASNLPDGEAASGGGQTESQNSETRTTTNFDISEITRNIERRPGAIKRLTVAVLINRQSLMELEDSTSPDTTSTERLQQEIEDIEELVAASVGLDPARGDRITVKALDFEPSLLEGTPPPNANWLTGLTSNPMQLLQLFVLSIVSLILAIFVVKPILSPNKNVESITPSTVLQMSVPNKNSVDRVSRDEAVAQRSDIGDQNPMLTSTGTAIQSSDGESLSSDLDARLTAVQIDEETRIDPISHLKSLIEERQPDTLEILKSWLEDDKVGKLAQ